MFGGGGAANNAAAQNAADELRDNPGTAERWDTRTWVWLGVAFVPFVAVVVLSIVFQ